MDRSRIEHRTEIRRANRTTPLWIAVVLASVLAVVVLGDRGGDGETAPIVPPTTADSGPPTSETLTTTSPREQLAVFGVTTTPQGLLPISSTVGPARDARALAHALDLLGPPVMTDGRVVVLAGGAILAGRPGEPFVEVVSCCAEGLHPSNESGHVWVHSGDEAALIQLDGGGTVTELPLADDEIVGPASFGLVTVDDEGGVRWRRPHFEPLDIPVPEGRVAVDSGGYTVLLASPADAGRHVLLERLSIRDGGVRWFDTAEDGSRTPAVLSPDGAFAAVRTADGWRIRDSADRRPRGTLRTDVAPAPVGGARFAVVVDGHVLLSDGSELAPRWSILAVAEQSP